jgi:hypothetical protein
MNNKRKIKKKGVPESFLALLLVFKCSKKASSMTNGFSPDTKKQLRQTEQQMP